MNTRNSKVHRVVCLGLFLISSQTNAKFFATMAVSEQEFLGCRDRGQDHKCISTIAIGCRTLCQEGYEPGSSMRLACHQLCQGNDPLLKIRKASPFDRGKVHKVSKKAH